MGREGRGTRQRNIMRLISQPGLDPKASVPSFDHDARPVPATSAGVSRPAIDPPAEWTVRQYIREKKDQRFPSPRGPHRCFSGLDALCGMKSEVPERPTVVLIIEDDRQVRLLARDVLEEAGFVVEEACDGREGVVKFGRVRPDVVLLDVILPYMNGMTVCRVLREMPGGERVPVVMMTALGDSDAVREAFDAGATFFVPKPINLSTLPEHLTYLVRSSRVLQELHESEAQNRALLNAIPDMMLHVCREGTILDFRAGNGCAYAAFGGNLRGRTIADLLPPGAATQFMAQVGHALATGTMMVCEYELEGPGGLNTHEARIVANGTGTVLAIVRDVTERRQSEEMIRYLAHHDSLTGLPNRIFFGEMLELVLSRARRDGKQVAILFVDLDDFKLINDTLGHAAGDHLLREAAQRLKGCVRSSDYVASGAESGLCGNIARFGGDEFILSLGNLDSVDDVVAVTQRIISEFSREFRIDGHEIFVSVSIGISMYPDDAEDTGSLVRNADMAMFAAKEEGGPSFRFFTRGMDEAAQQRLSIELSLRKALERGEIFVHYQPKVDLSCGEITGFEALARWHHPELGLIPPDTFIPLAEKNGLIVRIGEWVLRAACAQARTWIDEGFSDLCMAINLSSHQFTSGNLTSMVKEVLDETELPPSCLEFEITEGILMERTEKTMRILSELRDMGVRISIDDFGTGYSSLGYLKRFPVNTVKIDRSFVREIDSPHEDAAIIKAIIAVARNLNLQVVAEGVESHRQTEFLLAHGCNEAQGFLFGKPVHPDEASLMLRAGRWRDAPARALARGR
ncbi:response receiver-modulated diguanylate cyclase/phosphodiesterase [Geobacter sulfurreducens KN400]|nr:response receiver-modulated diguanylate cyclase/phosphodiesterase [Geobacter sulfurreducens KN400]